MDRLRWLVLLLILSGCTDQGDETAPAGPDIEPVGFAHDIQAIFTQSCARSGCHGDGSAAAGLDLSAGTSYTNLVGVPSTLYPTLKRVQAGEPDSSALYLLLQGALYPPMPLGDPALPTDKVEKVATWILSGALDN